MKYLLDTHALVWARQGDSRLGALALEICKNVSLEDLAIADITLLEISLFLQRKRVRSELPGAKFLRMMHAGLPVLPINAPIADRAACLALPQADPFDRLIVATTLEYRLVLITRDRAIVESGLVETVW